jgi:hypothetical protein
MVKGTLASGGARRELHDSAPLEPTGARRLDRPGAGSQRGLLLQD